MKKISVWGIYLLAFILSLISTYFSLRFINKKEVVVSPEPEEEIVYFDENVDDGRVNFLLLGYGGAGHDGGYLSDVVMLVSVDKLNKQVTLVSIPRDLWVPIQIQSDKTQNFKINAAYAIGLDDRTYPLKEPQYRGEFGGGAMSMKIVEDILDLKIHNFAAVDFGSFEKIIDLLGGVEVTVAKTFDDYFYPVKGLENETCGLSAEYIAEIHQKYSGFELEKQFTCRYEHLHFDAGTVHMNGSTALKFVRSRHSNEYGGDFARGERQNAVLFAAKDRLLSKYGLNKADDLYKEFEKLIKTDVNLATFKGLIKLLGDPKDYSIKHVSLSEENMLVSSKSSAGAFILIPKAGVNKWDKVQEFVNDRFQRTK